MWISLIILIVFLLVIFSIIFKKLNKTPKEEENPLLLQKLRLKEMELEQSYKLKIQEFEQKQSLENQQIQKRLNEIEKQEEFLKNEEEKFARKQKAQEKLVEQYTREREKLKTLFSQNLGISIEEMRKRLCEMIEDDLIDYKGKLIRKYENEAREEARKKANYIIAQATTRYAGEFATERLINVITLPSDELKGRIIGKEGRNIKTIEMITGVDVIIDDTPSSIVLSSFNLYRRAIATKLIEALVEDGRIQPSRIEEVYERIVQEMEDQITQDGEDVVLDLGLGYMHPELKKLVGKMKYRASFGQNALGHSIEVARLAGIIAGELGGDAKMARRAGLLHDIGKALTQELGGNHVDIGYELCEKYQESPIVLNAIKSHHGYEEALSVEAAAVCTADVLSAARPGARREALENFLQRAIEIEELINQKLGVKQSYVINSGREIRVIVEAEILSDEGSAVLAKEIAKEIEEGFQYPGEIKINVIRECRSIEYAK
ncbi:ribonuclease Y [uncultured Helicobacter sp.]|uniref:ribonuclease Y n=1 Tax=uncultured Helicobacter sp. TaxID=175537 RepID=UPI002611C252|nr:ribonuclease Y [uncultured Helicobacter sp.]